MNTIETCVAPTALGQRVRFTTYGGNVRQYMVGVEGSVARFTRTGNAVIWLDAKDIEAGALISTGHVLSTRNVTDALGCAKVLNADGTLARQIVECK